MDNIYGVTITKDNSIEVFKGIVELYVTMLALRTGKRLRPKLVSVLTYYLKYGYNKKTKKIISKALNIKTANLTVMNGELTKLGFLVTDQNNFHLKDMNSELQILKTFVEKPGKNKAFLFNLVNSSI